MPKKQRQPSYDWDGIKAEWVISDHNSLTNFFKGKDIRTGTWEKHTTGWITARQKHRQEIAETIQKRDVEAKILTVERQQEMMSGVLVGIINQWQRIYRRLSSHERNRNPEELMTKAQYAKDVELLTKVTRLMPELIRVNELLAGRPTDREDAVDADKMLAKRAQELQGNFEKWRERLAKEVEVGGYEIGNVSELPVERPAQAP